MPIVPRLVILFDGRLDLWLLVGAIAEGSMCGLFAVAEPVVAGFLYFESNRPASKCSWLLFTVWDNPVDAHLCFILRNTFLCVPSHRGCDLDLPQRHQL